MHPCAFLLALAACLCSALGQTPAAGTMPATPPPVAPAAAGALSLDDALRLARANSVDFQAALTTLASARQDRKIARDLLLPSVTDDNQYLYTQGGTHNPTPRYIANNAVHEYVSQGNVHEDLYAGGAHLAGLDRARAAEALATAQLEIARRGLDATVVADYYGLLAAGNGLETAQEGVTEAQRFVQITRQLEQGGEAAHADVLRAELELQTRQRAAADAALAAEQARLNLAVLLSPRFDETFTLVDDLAAVPPLPGFDRLADLAARNNPTLQAALAAERASALDVRIARAGYLPTLSLDYWYGIDAPDYATYSHSPLYGRVPDLGDSAAATLTIPVWNWGATGSRVRQAELQQAQAQVAMSYAQRKALADLHGDYDEAQTALQELDSLRQSVADADESLRLTMLRYQAGEAAVLEVVDAQNGVIEAHDQLAAGEVRYRIGLAALATLTGPF